MTWLGFAAVGSLALSMLRSKWFPWFLAIFAGIPYSVAVIVGGNGVVPFFVLAIAVAAIICLRFISGNGRPLSGPGTVPLALFAVWSILITATGPALFRGNPVLSPRGGTDLEVYDPSPLEFTISNAAQISYLLLGLGVVLYLASASKLSARLPSAAFWTGIGLSFMQLVVERVGLPWPREAFSNSPNVRYIDFLTDGSTLRYRGIFAEPSALGLFGVTAIVYFLTSAIALHGAQRLRNLAGLVVSAIVVLMGGTGTALAGGAVVLAVGTVIAVVPWLMGRTKWDVGLILTGLAAFIVMALMSPILYGAARGIILEKIGTQSYDVRTTSNAISIDILAESFGLGVGLGSSKPNSFFTMLLSCVGVVGTLLFVVAVLALVRAAWKHDAYRPAAWALLGFFLIKAVSGSEMSSPIMYILIGVCAHGAWKVKQKDPVSPSRYSSVPRRVPHSQYSPNSKARRDYLQSPGVR